MIKIIAKMKDAVEYGLYDSSACCKHETGRFDYHVFTLGSPRDVELSFTNDLGKI